jgi:hypothetical protein
LDGEDFGGVFTLREQVRDELAFPQDYLPDLPQQNGRQDTGEGLKS